MKSSAASAESVALLIDADNAPAANIQSILAALTSYGEVNIRRAYGNWKRQELARWEDVLHKYAIQPVQQFDLIKGKNASDMAMLIDAMDILYTKNVGTFGLVSSDCDFTPLIFRLREDGKQVIGFGETKAPAPFVNSCTRFVYLDEEKKKVESALPDKSLKARRLKEDAKLMALLCSAVTEMQEANGWAMLGRVGGRLVDQGFDKCKYGFSSLGKLFAAIDLFEVDLQNGHSSVRLLVREQTSAPSAVQRWFSENGSWSGDDGL